MSNMKRHIGKTTTDQRCVVVFMQIPNREDHALIVPVDSLPPRIEAAVMEVVESQEGQADPVLANVLSRRLMPDMGNTTVLQALHELGLLSALPIDNVIMLPTPNMPFPLRQLLQQMGREVPTGKSMQSQPETQNAAEVKYNPYDTAAIEASEENKAKAQIKLMEASLLEDEANKKREEAYRFDPSLRPKPVKAMAAKKAEPAADETLKAVVKKAKTTRTKKSASA